MPIVNYGQYRVSDEHLRIVLDRIAEETRFIVRVTSGDRDFIPKGGAGNSLHLINEAVDFHLETVADQMAFTLIRIKRKAIFGDAKGKAFRYQVIWHGPYTETQAQHLHLGYLPEGREVNTRAFMIEGATPSTRRQYTIIEMA